MPLSTVRQAEALAALDAEAARPQPAFVSLEWWRDQAGVWRRLAEADGRRANAAERDLHEVIDGPVIGEWNAERAAALAEPVYIFRTGQAWVDAGRVGVLVVDWNDPRLIGRLWLGAHRVIVEDHETVRLLRDALARASRSEAA